MTEGKPKLIILSDLFGKEHSDWISNYIEYLSSRFEIVYYDSKTLGEINIATINKEQIHQSFLKAGINKAVENLLEKETENINVLAFSIGGTIAWRAALQGLNLKSLWTVSSTRLRYETLKPKNTTTLFYGDNDPYKPDINWFKKLNMNYHIFQNKSHEMYKEPEIIKSICNNILLSFH